jgi:hypothetical protein
VGKPDPTTLKPKNSFEPNFVNAKVGDRIKFQFFPKNHTLTQSPFETPCTAQPFGIDSGFTPVADELNTKWFEFEVKDDSKPLWFYCQQGTHCSKDGMVFAVNPPASGPKTFDAFQKLATSGAPAAPPAAGKCPPQDNTNAPLVSETPGAGQIDCDYGKGGPTCVYSTNAAGNLGFISGSSDCFNPDQSGQPPAATSAAAPAASAPAAAKCPAVDDNKSPLVSESLGDQSLRTCNYGAGTAPCVYFDDNGTFSSGGSTCPDALLASTSGASPNAVNAISGALEGDSSTSGGFGSWAPIVIGLLAGNLLVTLILVGFTVLGYVRRGGRDSRSISPSYVPVKTKELDGNRGFPSGSYRDDDRSYGEQ